MLCIVKITHGQSPPSPTERFTLSGARPTATDAPDVDEKLTPLPETASADAAGAARAVFAATDILYLRQPMHCRPVRGYQYQLMAVLPHVGQSGGN